MSKYIDADRLIRRLENRPYKAVPNFIKMVEEQEAADVQEVKHGRWIEADDDGTMDKCSVCGEYSCCRSPYCGECGAKMDEVTE